MISLSENGFTSYVCTQTHIHEHTGLSPGLRFVRELWLCSLLVHPLTWAYLTVDEQ